MQDRSTPPEVRTSGDELTLLSHRILNDVRVSPELVSAGRLLDLVVEVRL